MRNAVRTDTRRAPRVLREISKVQAFFASRAALLFLELIGALVSILVMFTLDTGLGLIGVGGARGDGGARGPHALRQPQPVAGQRAGDGGDRDRAERPALASRPGAGARPGAGHAVPLAAPLQRGAGGGGGHAQPHRGAARDRDAGLRPAEHGRLPLCRRAAVRRLGHRRHADQRLFPDGERAAPLLPADEIPGRTGRAASPPGAGCGG